MTPINISRTSHRQRRWGNCKLCRSPTGVQDQADAKIGQKVDLREWRFQPALAQLHNLERLPTYSMSQPQMIIVCVAVGVALVGFGIVWWRHRRLTPWQLVLWYSAKFVVRFLWRAKQPSKLPIEYGKGAVIVCNHRSSVDPFFIQTLADWPLHFMVAREYCDQPGLGCLLRSCEVIPTSRSGIDTTSIRTALRLTAAGEVVGMLPEGRINISDEFMMPVRPGAVMVALKSQVPIVPCYLEGVPYGGTPLSPFFKFANVRVVCGDPIDLSEYYGRENEEGLIGELTLKVVSELAKLAGQDDFQPKLAGRKWKPV